MAKPMTKYCGGCKERKTLDGFHRRSDTKDGLQTTCIECVRASRVSRGKRKAQSTEGLVMLWIRVPPSLKQRLANLADAQRTSMTRAAISLLDMSLTIVEKKAADAGKPIGPESFD